MLKIEPALPMLTMLPKLNMVPTLQKPVMLSKLFALNAPAFSPRRGSLTAYRITALR